MEKLAFIYSMVSIVDSLSYAELSDLTPIEGMACGSPAVVHVNTAQPELVDETTGYVVPTGHLEALTNAIFEIGENGRGYYSTPCIRRVKENFNKEK